MRRMPVTREMRTRVMSRDSMTCQYCGDSSGKIVLDHVVPVCRGGDTHDHNLVAACEPCNIKKRSLVWIPNNFDALKVNRPDWQDMVMTLKDLPYRPARNKRPPEDESDPTRRKQNRVFASPDEMAIIRGLLKDDFAMAYVCDLMSRGVVIPDNCKKFVERFPEWANGGKK